MLQKKLKDELINFLKKNKKADLITTYLFFLEKKYDLEPVLFPKEKKIYQSLNELIDHLEKENKLYHETEIKIQFGKEDVNEQTTKIYICPHTGKVFGDNTHPNPQDAIYEWVSTCPENKENDNGMKIKRFFVSEDPEVIKNYINKRTKPILKKSIFFRNYREIIQQQRSCFRGFQKKPYKKIKSCRSTKSK